MSMTVAQLRSIQFAARGGLSDQLPDDMTGLVDELSTALLNLADDLSVAGGSDIDGIRDVTDKLMLATEIGLEQ